MPGPVSPVAVLAFELRHRLALLELPIDVGELARLVDEILREAGVSRDVEERLGRFPATDP